MNGKGARSEREMERGIEREGFADKPRQKYRKRAETDRIKEHGKTEAGKRR